MAGKAGKAWLRTIAPLALASALVGCVLATSAGATSGGQIGEAWGSEGTGAGQFHLPAIAGQLGVDPSDGSVYLGDVTTDKQDYRVQKLSPAGAPEASVEIPRFSEEKLVVLYGVAVDPTLDRVYLLEACRVSRPTAGCKKTGSIFAATQVLVYSTVPGGAGGDELVPPSGGPATLPAPSGTATVYAEHTQPVIAVDPSSHELVLFGEDEDTHHVVQRIDSATGAEGVRFVDSADKLRPAGGALAKSIAVGPDGTTYTMSGGRTPGSVYTRAWELPPGPSPALQEVPHFEETAESQSWETGLISESYAQYAGGPQIAVSPDGEMLYWKELLEASSPTEPGIVLIRGFSLTAGTTTVAYGGREYEEEGVPQRCSIATQNAPIAPTGEDVVVFDHGPAPEEEGEALAYGPRVIAFGPSGDGCPTPVAAFSIDEDPEHDEVAVSKGELVAFDASDDSGLLGGVPRELTWKFGDGTEETVVGTPEEEGEEEGEGPSTSIEHAYCETGPMEVTLEMALEGSTFGDPPPVVKTANVGPAAPATPIAAFTTSTTSPAAGASVAFNAANSIDPHGGCAPGTGFFPTHTLKGYRWDFGDGGEANTVNPTVEHTFSNSGSSSLARTVTLTVTGDEGAKGSTSHTVTVQGSSSGGGGGGSDGGGSGGGGGSSAPAPAPAPEPVAPPPSAKPKLTAEQRALAKCKKLKGKKKAKCIKETRARFKCKKLKGKKKAKCIKRMHRSGKRKHHSGGR